jgi:hypothetical protein
MNLEILAAEEIRNRSLVVSSTETLDNNRNAEARELIAVPVETTHSSRVNYAGQIISAEQKTKFVNVINSMPLKELHKFLLYCILLIEPIRNAFHIKSYYKNDINNKLFGGLLYDDRFNSGIKNIFQRLKTDMKLDDLSTNKIDFPIINSIFNKIFITNETYDFSASASMQFREDIFYTRCHICDIICFINEEITKGGRFNKHDGKFICNCCMKNYNFSYDVIDKIPEFTSIIACAHHACVHHELGDIFSTRTISDY